MESGELQYLRQHAGAAVRLLDDLSYECRDTARANIREVATLAQGIVVLGPVGHLVFWLGELVAAVLAVFVGHLLFLSMKSIRIMPFQQNGGRVPFYATPPIFPPSRAKPATWHARSPSSPNLAAKARSSRCRKSSSQRPCISLQCETNQGSDRWRAHCT